MPIPYSRQCFPAHIIKNVSETLAGRVEFVDMAGFDLSELGPESHGRHSGLAEDFPVLIWLATSKTVWPGAKGFIRTFLQRDIPQLGITIPAAAIRRFWTMLAHYHGQVWNASRVAAAMGINDKTARSYLDILHRDVHDSPTTAVAREHKQATGQIA